MQSAILAYNAGSPAQIVQEPCQEAEQKLTCYAGSIALYYKPDAALFTGDHLAFDHLGRLTIMKCAQNSET